MSTNDLLHHFHVKLVYANSGAESPRVLQPFITLK